MTRSVKYNYILNLVNIVLGIVFPLITFPYVTRILTPEGIGKVQFYSTIIEYVTLFVALGIPLYGVREIAKVRDNKELRNKITVEVLVLHLILTIIGYIAIFILCLIVSQIQENQTLFLIISISLALGTIGTQWFFQAIEDFTYITIRSLIVRVIGLILLFVLVRNGDDVLQYAIVLTCGSAGNNVFNFVRLKKYISIDVFRNHLEPFHHLVPTLKIFLLNVTVGIYTQLATLLLGTIQTNEAVAYYAMPQRIANVVLCVVTALSGVLLPRLSNYIGNHQSDQFKDLGNKAITFVLAITLPMAVGLMLLSESITVVMFGETYHSSYLVLVIWAPIIAIIGLSQVYGKSLLYSTGHELLMTFCTFLGMLTFLLVGILGIIHYSFYGAAVASLIAEGVVTLSMMIIGRKYHPCTIFRKENLTYLMASLIMSVPVYLCTFLDSNILTIIAGVISGIVTYCLILAIRKDLFYIEVKDYLINALSLCSNQHNN